MAIYGHIRLGLMMSVCVLICLEIYADLLCDNWSKICQKCQFHPTLDPKYLMRYLYIVPGDFILLSMVIYDWNWYVSVRFDLFWGLLRSSGEKLVKHMPQMPILSHPESRISNIVQQHCAKTSSITIYGHIVIMTDMPAWFMEVSRTKDLLNTSQAIEQFLLINFKGDLCWGYGSLQGQKLVRILNIAKLTTNLDIRIWCF